LYEFLEDTNRKIKKANVACQMGRAHEGRGAEDAVREADLPTISHKTWQAENPDVLLGRSRPAVVAPFPVCSRTAAPFSTLPRVSSFTFVLTRAHLPALHSHFLTAYNIGTVFFKKIL
jgi:hypothetical protein